MALPPNIVILYSPAGGGHRSVANAVGNALKRERGDAKVEVLDVQSFAPRWFRYDLAWAAVQNHGGHLWDWLFRKTDRGMPEHIDKIRHTVNRALLRKLTTYLKERQPDRIVCTHFLPAVAISKLKQSKSLHGHLSIVVTDFVAHEAWIYPGVDDYFVPSPAVARSIMRRDVPWHRVHITGIPVAPTMDEPPIQLAHKLPLEVLVLTSGVPLDLVLETVGSIRREAPLKLSIVAGNDADKKRALERLVAERGLNAQVHGQLPGLRDALDAAHVVVTKTGGLVTTECLARGRAMVLPWPAFGQEHGNLMKVVESGAAMAASDHRDVGAMLEGLAGQPARLAELSDKALRAAIRGSARRVARYLLKGLPGSTHFNVSGITYAV